MTVVLDDLLRQVVSAKSGLQPVPTLELSGGAVSVVGHPTRLERVIGHLVQNAIDATPPEGRVVIRLLQHDGCAIIAIVDTGCGMSEQFMHSRLFRPFESTKAMGMGIGTYEAQQYVRELGGRIEVESREAEGTHFRVILPLSDFGHATEGNAVVESQA